jgi:L-lysine exporter family protein LysE/ArgO
MLPQEIASIFVFGFAFGSVSLLSIGPNNVLLLREGLAGSRPLFVASVMWCCYAALLGLAVFAGRSVQPSISGVAWILEWGGVLALAVMGLVALRKAGRRCVEVIGVQEAREAWTDAAGRVLRVVWLNPLTYLELLAIPAALAVPLTNVGQLHALFAGLLSAFAINCFGFVLGASLLAPLFRRSSAIRVFDGLSGAIMLTLALLVAASAASKAADRSPDPMDAAAARHTLHSANTSAAVPDAN